MNEYLQDMERYARQNDIPVILPDTRQYLCDLVATRQPATILEIGMAIGFSASCMMLACPKTQVVDLEASLPNIALARQNFEALGLTERVEIIEGDCMQTLPKLVEAGKRYDMIFLDGPKGKYVEMMPYLLSLLREGGIWVSDNVLFKGMVRGGKPILEHKYKHTVATLREFLDILENDKTLNTQVLDIGDGLSVVTKKERI